MRNDWSRSSERHSFLLFEIFRTIGFPTGFVRRADENRTSDLLRSFLHPDPNINPGLTIPDSSQYLTVDFSIKPFDVPASDVCPNRFDRNDHLRVIDSDASLSDSGILRHTVVPSESTTITKRFVPLSLVRIDLTFVLFFQLSSTSTSYHPTLIWHLSSGFDAFESFERSNSVVLFLAPVYSIFTRRYWILSCVLMLIRAKHRIYRCTLLRSTPVSFWNWPVSTSTCRNTWRPCWKCCTIFPSMRTESKRWNRSWKMTITENWVPVEV